MNYNEEELANKYFEKWWQDKGSKKIGELDSIDKELCRQAFFTGYNPPANEEYPYGKLIAEHTRAAELIQYDLINRQKSCDAYYLGMSFRKDLDRFLMSQQETEKLFERILA